ncbi:nitroreductase [Alicyclobacillus hesperidum URH17-3-68]|uniref:NADPH-flavin oxidoreductase n=1 Tax=Alicyclobacillus hesperidum TaxID=89784 RepID=A0A1H2Y7D6_9BACL|nr:nitroreductase family protein [Alicyclobacillus hesperidum]EJY56128.1 nitroreductase [Alicyclobacillus hesperidum URH17-3-68]KRW91028.1 nitroreductase [Alicyclobacillus tengchongensis]GLV14497.1 NADPH-flavin oxidoreductase [Alicyclobacillus hesperidum]SDX00564.1 Nitroreductase [Alicyclobacillus hesperidum]
MDVLEAIRTRRHIKFFKPEPIDEALWMSWLEEAKLAPNHKMTEPWQVLVVGPETRAQLKHGQNFGDAPLVLAILAKRGQTQVERDENLMAVSCFIQNFSLLAQSHGAGIRWTSIGWTDAARETLGVGEDYEVANIIGVGYPREVPEAKPREAIANRIKRLP